MSRSGVAGLSATYINMHSICEWYAIQYYLTAFNCVLTWMKLFKFLTFFPALSILSRTLSKGASSLASALPSTNKQNIVIVHNDCIQKEHEHVF